MKPTCRPTPPARINVPLFDQRDVENICGNAADAMDGRGSIDGCTCVAGAGAPQPVHQPRRIPPARSPSRSPTIGKGIPQQQACNAVSFVPGCTTKRRG
ncbi:MAG: hypothetical protein WKG07_26670 [Hymenobacter sp.]